MATTNKTTNSYGTVRTCPKCGPPFPGYLPDGSRCPWCRGLGKVEDGGASMAFTTLAPPMEPTRYIGTHGFFMVLNMPPEHR